MTLTNKDFYKKGYEDGAHDIEWHVKEMIKKLEIEMKEPNSWIKFGHGAGAAINELNDLSRYIFNLKMTRFKKEISDE